MAKSDSKSVRVNCRNGLWYVEKKVAARTWLPITRPWLSESEARNQLAAGL